MNIEAIRDYWNDPNKRWAVTDILALCDEVQRLRGVAHDFTDELRVKSIRIAKLEAENAKVQDNEDELAVTGARIAELEAELANHRETLRGIASMPVEDGERMQLWARDGLSGYAETNESTLLDLSDEKNKLQTELTSLKEAVRTLRGALMESESVVVQVSAANPVWHDHVYGSQDPYGAHKLVEKIRSALEATKEAGDAKT